MPRNEMTFKEEVDFDHREMMAEEAKEERRAEQYARMVEFLEEFGLGVEDFRS